MEKGPNYRDMNEKEERAPTTVGEEKKRCDDPYAASTSQGRSAQLQLVASSRTVDGCEFLLLEPLLAAAAQCAMAVFLSHHQIPPRCSDQYAHRRR